MGTVNWEMAKIGANVRDKQIYNEKEERGWGRTLQLFTNLKESVPPPHPFPGHPLRMCHTKLLCIFFLLSS